MHACAIVPLPQTVSPAAAFSLVGGETPLIRVVRAVRGHVLDAGIVVATVPALASEARGLLRAAGLDVAVTVTEEGGSRRQVLAAGLKHVGAERHSSTPVLVCDVRYPLASGEVAARMLTELRDGRDVSVPVLAVTDTVKTVDERGRVLGTVDRATLGAVQYPRGFTAGALWGVLSGSSATPSDLDEFAAAMRAGLDIGTVEGDANGVRVELPRDAHLVEALIACRRG